MTDSVAPLHVADEAFMVASMIERCPKIMMIRELMKNALEAACQASRGNRLVEIGTIQIEGVDKLVIWNTGQGMSDRELLTMCDLASSIGKAKSLTGNFGMGAKVASLPQNQLGMRYRSCKGGRVHEVFLCKRDGVYGRLKRFDPDTGDYYEVLDTTENAKEEGRPLEYDWTEVVLLGNRLKQNTVVDPYNGDPEQDVQWLATYLYHRFYRLPEGVKVTLLAGTHKLDGNRQFEPIPARLRHFERRETVALPNGIKIHYLYDAPYNGTGHNKSISGAIASAVSTCAIVYKDELFDLHKGKDWQYEAPIFGIPFGAKHISVHIELPDKAPIIPEAYRVSLQYTTGEHNKVEAQDFAEFVREHRPPWLIEVIKSFAPESPSNDDIRAELQRLMNRLRVSRLGPRIVAHGSVQVDPGNGRASEPSRSRNEADGGDRPRQKPTDFSIVPKGAKRAELLKNIDRAPEIRPLHDEKEIEEKGLKGRAARYYMESNDLFVNMLYPAVGEMKAQLEAEYAAAPDLDLMRNLATQNAERTIILKVGRAVVFALAKQLNKEWDQNSMEIASSPESLSMAADDFADAMQNARRTISRVLRTRSQIEAAA